MNLKFYNKNPNNNFLGFLSELDKELDNFWLAPADQHKSTFLACDFHEDKDNYFISMDLPGLQKENLKINYANQILTISGERKEEGPKAQKEGDNSRFFGKVLRLF